MFTNTKERIEQDERIKMLWCFKCLKRLTLETTWVPDDTHNGRTFCIDCAPDSAIRAKDLS